MWPNLFEDKYVEKNIYSNFKGNVDEIFYLWRDKYSQNLLHIVSRLISNNKWRVIKRWLVKLSFLLQLYTEFFFIKLSRANNTQYVALVLRESWVKLDSLWTPKKPTCLIKWILQIQGVPEYLIPFEIHIKVMFGQNL